MAGQSAPEFSYGNDVLCGVTSFGFHDTEERVILLVEPVRPNAAFVRKTPARIGVHSSLETFGVASPTFSSVPTLAWEPRAHPSVVVLSSEGQHEYF